MNPMTIGKSPQLWTMQQANASMRLPLGGNGLKAGMLFGQHGLPQSQQHSRSLTVSPQAAAQQAFLQALARDKRMREDDIGTEESPSKKQRKQEEPAPVMPSQEGIDVFEDNDVLSGRGGGTNVHPGNRYFRDLINRNRRAYLKAKKNDKPAISRAIVKAVRERGGRFLKREEGSSEWFEIGDNMAREKTSQALRQRAPEMRKVLFESEMKQVRQQVEQLQKNQRILGGMRLGFPQPGLATSSHTNNPTRMLNPFAALPKEDSYTALNSSNAEAYAQYSQNMMTAALLGGGINRISPHGA